MDRKGLLVLILALGCGDDGTAIGGTEGSSSDGATTSGPTASSAASSSTDASTSSSSTTDAGSSSSESSTGPVSTCGDGTVDRDEECDDGNTDDGDACSSTCALPFTIAWTRSFDGADHLHDEGRGVAIGEDGSIFVVGHVYSLAQDFDVWLRQYAADGSLGWTFTFDGAAQYDSGAAVAVHPSGDLIVVGTTRAADIDVLVLRVAASDQSVVWQATYDGAFNDEGSAGDYGHAVAIDPGGDVLVAGRERGNDSSHDIWLARYDADGNELWHTAYPAVTADEGAGVIVDDAGVAWLAGTLDLTDNDSGWLGGYAADGTLVDEHAFPFHGFHDVTLASEGRLVICGRRPSAGVNDASAMVLDETFEPVWELLHDGAAGSADAFVAVASSASGDVYVTGYEYVQHLGIDQDIIVARLSGTDGTPVWIDRYDSEIEMDDVGTGIAIAPDGGIVVVGYGNAFGENRNVFVRKYVEP